MMDKLELQRLRDLPIEGVAGRLGLHVVRHKALCPFHDDHHASLSFSVRRNTFRCFVCDAHGGTIDLAMRLLPSRGGREGSFLDACRWLADEHNVILTEYKPKETKPPKPFDAQRYERFFLRPWLSPEARRFLYDERQLDERVRPSPFPLPLRQPMLYLQPARAKSPSSRGTAVDHRGLL